MDVSKLFNDGGWIVPNPKYDKRKKHQTEPPFIKTTNSASMEPSIARSAFAGAANTRVGGDISKLMEYGVTPYDDMNIDAVLAEKQSNWTKLGNALAQTIVSEIGLGTLKGVSDLFDMTIGRAFNQDGDYSNPVSQKLGELQEKFNNEVAPIYATPGLTIDNGGLTDFGWWASNIPSIASSLTLLIPSTGVTRGLSALGKATKAFKGIGNIRKAATGLRKLEKAVDVAREAGDANKLLKAEKALKNMEGLSDFSKWINRGSVVKNTNRFFEYGVNALASRAMENYQEASQVYSDLLLDITRELNKLNPQEYERVVEQNKDILQDVDINNREEVAKKIAHEGAAKTFTDDMLNIGFDIVELYGLRNLKGFMNGPARASVRRAHLNDLKTQGLDVDEAKAFLKNRKWTTKAGEKISDALYGSRVAIGAQLSEGAEEAINYIAQEEGMHYGHILLKGEKDPTTFGDRLKGYLAAPGLHDSAFWGVLGGVVFQAGGSKLKRIENAYQAAKYKEKTEAENAEKTGEQRAETHWFKDFVLPEILSRKNNIYRRRDLMNSLKDELTMIENGKNPWAKDPETNQNLDIEGGANGEIANILRDKAYNSFAQNVMMDAMFSGNWDLAKEYLASNEVKQYLVEKGMLSQEEADKRQREVKTLADKLDKSYDNNMRAIENALHGTDSKTGANLDEIPFEFYQLVAADNMRYELDAEQAQRNIDNWQPTIGSEEERLAKELGEQNVDYKRAIKAFVLSKELGEVQAALDDANKTLEEGRSNNKGDIDPRTLEGQAAIKELELRKKVLTHMLGDYIEADEHISQQAKQLSIIRAAAGTIKEDGKFTYSRDSEKFKALDAAILKANDISRKLNKDKDKTTPEEWSSLMASIFGDNREISKEEWDSISYQANIFDEMVGHALGADGMMKSLDNLSRNLLNAYVGVVQNEIVKQVSLSNIAIGRDKILEQVHFKHNVMVESRNAAIQLSNMILKNLAKNKYDEHGDISELLAYGAIDENARKQLKEILSSDELAKYDDAMAILAISKMNGAKLSAVNASLPEVIKNTIYWSARDKFEDVVAITGDEDERIDRESSSASEDSISDTSLSTPSTSSTPPPSSPEPSSRGIELDFSTDKNGNSLPQKQASLTMTDDGVITGLTQKTDGSEDVTANLIPVEDINDSDGSTITSEDTFDLDFGNDIKRDVFGSTQLFNGTDKRLDDNAVVLSLPRITINSDGSIKELVKGEIGIGEPVDVSSESPAEAPSAEPTDEFSQDELNAKVSDATITEIARMNREGLEITEDTVSQALIDLFVGEGTPEQLKIALDNSLAKRKRLISKVNAKNTEVEAVVDAMSSAIADNATPASKGKTILDDAFKNLLNNYVTRAYIRDTKYGKVISLENLLRYCNQVTEDNDVANILYKYCVKQLHAFDDIVILEEIGSGNLSETRINSSIVNSSKYTEDLIEDASVSGRTIDFGWVLKNIKDDNVKKQEFFDTIYNLKAGDKLTFNITGEGQYVEIYSGDKLIGTLKAPIEEPDRFKLIHKGWIVDIPKVKEGSIGRLEQLFINCIANPNNDPKFEKVKEALYDAVYASKSELPEALDDIMNALAEAVPLDELNRYLYPDTAPNINRSRAGYLLDIFRGFKIASDKWLASHQMSAEELYSALEEEIADSVHNWFAKLYDSSIAISILKNNPTATMTIGSNNIGAIRSTKTEPQPINQEGVIGSEHEGQVFVGVLPFNGSAIHLPTGELVNHYGGSSYTFIAIRKPDGTYGTTLAYPNLINANHYSAKVAQIRKDIHKGFKKRFRKWFATRGHKVTTDELYDFFNKLCHSRNGNVPLCQGITVNRMTNGKHGITIEWKENIITPEGEETKETKRIRLYDRNLNNTADVSNIQLPGDKIGYGHGYYDESHKWHDVTKEVTDKILKILDDNLKFDINLDYVKDSAVDSGYARKTEDGRFIINIPNGREIEFESYNDFVINEGIISVATKSDEAGKRNFYNPNESTDNKENPTLTFNVSTEPIASESTPTVKKDVDINIENNIVDRIKNDIISNSSDDKLANRIFKTLLEKSVLKNLKGSTLIKSLQIKNIKFVGDFKDDFAAHINEPGVINGVKVNVGDIIVTNRWLNLIKEDTRESKEQAVRHLIHEAVHKQLRNLSKEKRSKLFEEIRSIFNDFVKANDNDNRTDHIRAYEYNLTNEDTQRYYNEDGTINERGLEEFLVESITRPELIQRLNEIAVDDKTIQKAKVGISKPKTLLQRIISSIINAFGEVLGLKINRNSLLEKEYKLFEQLSLDFENQTASASEQVVVETKTNTQTPTVDNTGQLSIMFDFEEEQESSKKEIDSPNPVERNNAPVDDIVSKVDNLTAPTTIDNSSSNDELAFDDTDDIFDGADDSRIEDGNISSHTEVRQSINPENRETFDNLIDSGVISVKC